MNNNMKNKAIIIVTFLIIVAIIFGVYTQPNQKLKKISDEEALSVIKSTFGENVERVDGQALSLAKTNNYMTMVAKDQYFLIDFSQRPPKIHHFKSNAPDIEVEVLKIEEHRFLVKHDDHEHWVEGELDSDTKVGDKIFIKDPHTYLQDNHRE